MKYFYSFKSFLFLLYLFIVACEDNNESSEHTQESNMPEILVVTTGNVNTGDIHYNLLLNSEVSMSDNWHIGIERDTSNYNMPSFVPGDVQIAVYDNKEFGDLVSLPE